MHYGHYGLSHYDNANFENDHTIFFFFFFLFQIDILKNNSEAKIVTGK